MDESGWGRGGAVAVERQPDPQSLYRYLITEIDMYH